MKKKVIFIRCAKILCLILCLALLSGLAADLCQYHDYNVTRFAGFYAEPKDSLDVVFLGASDVFSGFSSAYAYERFGFTSYPFVQDSNPASLYKSQLQEVLKHQDPKWIVVELNGFLYNKADPDSDAGSVRRYLSSIPMNWNRIKTAWELAPEDQRLYYLYPLAKDHSNWKAAREQVPLLLEYYNICLNGAVLKGNVSTMNLYSGPDHRDVSDDASTSALNPEAEQYLVSFLEYCREENIENVLFVRFPHIVSSDALVTRYRKANEAGRIIESYGYDFLNLERDFDAIGLSATEDFYNNDHTNYRGQKKLTEYLGRIFAEDYGVAESQLTASQKQDWDRAVDYSRKFYAYAENHMATGLTGTLMEDRKTLALLDTME